MLGEIVAATQSLKAISDIATGLQNLKTTAEVHAQAIELNQKILAAQHQLFAANAEQIALAERVRELESQIARMKDWETQKQRYKLATPFSGSFLYALQKASSDGEPPHYICTNCYQAGERYHNRQVGLHGIRVPETLLQNSSAHSVARCCGRRVRRGYTAGDLRRVAPQPPN